MHLHLNPLHRNRISSAAAALLILLSTAAQAQTPVPSADLPGLSDPPGLSRYAGSVLIYRNESAYDEVKLPVSKSATVDGKIVAPKTLDRSGQRVSLQYITPAGRSAL